MFTEFDIGPLSWVKDEIDRALQEALTQAAEFAKIPDNTTPLRFCQTHVHQVTGALAMVGLDGVKHFSEEIERYIAALEKHQVSAGGGGQAEILANALRALRFYIQSLMDGAHDVPLRLFPEFKAMLQARGMAQVHESELFFPDLFNTAPAGLETFVPEGLELQAYLNELGQKYRKMLVQWLKAPRDEATLSGMLEALHAVERAHALPSQKTLWWAAVGLLEAIAQDGLELDKHTRQLFVQLERQIHYLAQGNTKPNTRMLRDVLYFISISAPVSERLREIKDVFELEKYQQLDAPDMGQQQVGSDNTAVLQSLQTGVAELKQCWMQASAGDITQRSAFLGQARSLIAEAENQYASLDLTLADIVVCAEMLVAAEAPLDAMLCIEMATTLLMLESALESSGKSLAAALDGVAEQAASVRAMLPGAETAQPSAASPESNHDEIVAVLAHVADEIRANLQRIEQTLDDFFRNTDIRDELSALTPLLKQVGGAFRMLEQPVAVAVIEGVQSMITRFAAAPGQAQLSDFELVAESLSSLGFYLDRLLQGNGEASRALDPLSLRLQAALAIAPPEPVVISAEHTEPEPGAQEVAIDRAIDDELLEVYVAEAGEVQETIAGNIKTLRAHPNDHHALVTMRRAFHTLKGSGRTVGLAAMGEVAWSVEQLLNHLLDVRGDVASPVLDFVDAVSNQFQDWVRQLFTKGDAHVAVGEWKVRAEALQRPEMTQTDDAASLAAEPEVTAEPVIDTPKEALVQEVIVIGGKQAINRQLFELFLTEAKNNLALLHKILAAAQTRAEPPIPDIERPAHTLGGVSRTVGLGMLSELCGALELWLGKIAPRFATLTHDELHLFDQSLVALQSMLQKVGNRRLPSPAQWLFDALCKAIEVSEPNIVAQDITTGAEQVDTHDEATIAPIPMLGRDALDSVPSFIAEADAANIDRQLLEVFLEESNELIPLVGRQLREWQATPDASEPQQGLQRALHTLKGSARMAGALRLGDDLHDLETQVEKVLVKGTPTARGFNAFFKQYDSISEQLDELRRHAEAPAAWSDANVGEKTAPEGLTVIPMMRVRADVIDQFVNEAGEVSIARSRIERQMETFKTALLELTDSVIRLRSQLREAEIEAETQMQSRLTQLQEAHETFDPLEFDRYTRFQELTRMMAESVHDVATVQQGLMANLNETEAALNEQARMTKQLQQGLMRTRMVRFDTVVERLHRVVRQTAAELKKPAELEIEGAAVEIDRSVLEKMAGPLEHLLRNAIAHGLEDPKRRAAMRKGKTGQVKIRARQEGNEIIIALRDDGGGLDLDKIKAKAMSLGLLDGAQESNLAELVAVIFEPGFSTSDNVTLVSGRGVGLDAVRADITALGGRIEVVSETGQGCTFTIYLPLTLAVNQTVLVRVGSDEFLLPSSMVEQVQKIKHDVLASIEAEGQFNWGGRQYPLYYLSRLLGRSVQVEPQPYIPIMLLRGGTGRIALIVDEIRGNREIVVKNIGPQLAGMGSIAGATVLGDGRVMLVLNPIHMALHETLAAEVPAAEAVIKGTQQPKILVVDDSLTMRKVISRLLTREGYHAVTAKDGMDALQQLETVMPEVILLDIEMPRMDGFELARAVRGNARTAHIPLIVISSRTADKHRTYAAELGVDVYLGKPYQEEELLTHLTAFVQSEQGHLAAVPTADVT